MKIIPRIIESRLRRALERQKSVLLLGPRQTAIPWQEIHSLVEV